MKKPIATMECEDCGKFIVADEKYLSIFMLEENEYCATTRCAHCDRPVFQSVNPSLIPRFQLMGVKVFSWRTGEEIAKELLDG